MIKAGIIGCFGSGELNERSGKQGTPLHRFLTAVGRKYGRTAPLILLDRSARGAGPAPIRAQIVLAETDGLIRFSGPPSLLTLEDLRRAGARPVVFAVLIEVQAVV